MRGAWLFLLLAACSTPPARMVGAYYHPKPDQPREIERMIEGDPGDPQAFTHTLAPIVRGEKEVWRDYLAATAQVGKGRLQVLLDVHVMATPEWLQGDRLFDLILRIQRSEFGRYVAGYYLCDEPFGRSHRSRPTPVDLAPIWDVVNVIRRAQRTLGQELLVVADYASVFPLLKRGGDPVRGGFADYTSDRANREEFRWKGQWVREVQDPTYAGGRPLSRGYGFFDEDVTMINWWDDADELRRWRKRIAADVPMAQVQFVLGYDHGANTEAANQAHLERTRALLAAGDEAGAGGYWFWAWQDIPAQGRTYKGVGSYWESTPASSRYAKLIEAIRE